ncbi:hypothetical protein Ddc_20946 [Ditylenchus destructor]|nr:hypothetical protein Ddc_20946 [Ditylenchus destructor]
MLASAVNKGIISHSGYFMTCLTGRGGVQNSNGSFQGGWGPAVPQEKRHCSANPIYALWILLDALLIDMASNDQLGQEILDLVKKTELHGSPVKSIFTSLTSLVKLISHLTTITELVFDYTTTQQEQIDELENRYAELSVMLQEMKNIDHNKDGKEDTSKSTK